MKRTPIEIRLAAPWHEMTSCIVIYQTSKGEIGVQISSKDWPDRLYMQYILDQCNQKDWQEDFFPRPHPPLPPSA